MKKSQLVEMIRAIVADEVKKQLPNVMSEMYIKKLMSESPIHKPKKTFEDTYQHELSRIQDDYVPGEMANHDEGIYQQGPIGRKNESITNKLLNKDNPLAMMYENVVPIDQVEVTNSSAPVLNEIQAQSMSDPREWGKMFESMVGESETSKPMQKSSTAIERDLEMRRKALDERKV